MLSLWFGKLQSREVLWDVHISQSSLMREAWGPSRRSSTGSQTPGTHAKVLSGHPASSVLISMRRESCLGSCALGLFMQDRPVASFSLHGAASPWLPSSCQPLLGVGLGRVSSCCLGQAPGRELGPFPSFHELPTGDCRKTGHHLSLKGSY